MWWPMYVSRYWPEYAFEHLWILPSSVPTMKRCSDTLLKSKQQPPARPESSVSSGSSLDAEASLRAITGSILSSFFDIVQLATRPSEEMEKKLSSFARSSSCQPTCQTGSVCLPVLMD